MPQTQLAGFTIDLVRKRMRSLRLTVYAADGRLRVAVPLRTSDAAIAEFLTARRDWIQKQQQKFAAREQLPQLQYETGEQHYYRGQAYTLRLIPTTGRARVVLHEAAGQLELHAPASSPPAHRAQLLTAWYRARLKEQLPALLAQWEPVVGARAAAWGVKQMRTRWGTCNIRARRIWLNLELVKRPLPCLEYVVVHELTHLHERLHNTRFWGLMDQFMPDWRQHKAALNQVMLSPSAHPDAD